jgi:hypothetical protein
MDGVPSESPDGLGYLEHQPTLISIDDQSLSSSISLLAWRPSGRKERSPALTWHSICSDRRYPDATEALKELDEQLGLANGVQQVFILIKLILLCIEIETCGQSSTAVPPRRP